MTHEILTRREQDAMVQATYFDTSFWGNPQDGWGPEALVAMVRGVRFYRDEYGYYVPDDVGAAKQALHDVATFLGFTRPVQQANALGEVQSRNRGVHRRGRAG